MYKETNNNNPFKHEECWEICRKNSKWCSQQLTKRGASRRQKSSVDSYFATPPSPTQTTPDSSSPPVLDATDPNTHATENTNIEGVSRPEGKKATKEKKRKVVAEKGVLGVLGNLQCTLERQFDLNREELEMKKEREKKDFELREKILNMEIKLKERNQKMKEKTQKRKEQERILEKDLTKLRPNLRETFQKMQAQILKEWENDNFLGEAFGSHNVDM